MKTTLHTWLSAARPKTLPLAVVSILTGSTLAFSNNSFNLVVAFLALVTATLLQILSNLANDYGDAVKGTDNAKRLGPARAIQSGQVSLTDMKRAIIINVVLTIFSGLFLVFYAVSGLQNVLAFLGLGVLAIAAAIAYTMGNKPYGYVGLGDVSVFLFFGLLGVMGSYFLQTGQLDWSLTWPAIGCGLLAVAVLNVNNLRDIENDAQCGKRTVAVRLGIRRAKLYHLALLLGALCAFAVYLLAQPVALVISLPFLLSTILLFKHGKDIWVAPKPANIAPMMPIVVKCSMLTNLLFVGVVIAQTLAS